MSLFHNRKSSISFQEPEEGGDGLREMIEDERQEGAIDLFSPETGEELEAYLSNALAMGGVALSDSEQKS
jgi:hypothetical protein